MKKLLLALLLAGFATQAFAQATFTAKDASGTTQTFKSINCSPICPLSVPVDSTGTPIWGTAGVSNSNVMSIQGIASGTAIAISAGSLPLPTGAATSALQTTINSTLGSPFQAGGSIGNTSFAATQATASNLNATIVGTGTFATQLTGATNNINNIAGTITLPTGAATSANQTNANQKTQVVDGSGNVIGSTSNALNVAITSGGGSGGTASSFGATFPATGTAIGAKNGANMVNLSADGSSNLNVNCAVGCSGGTASNASSGVATSSTNGQAVSWLYGFNGTTWDQLQVDGSKNLKTLSAQGGTWNITNISGTVSLPTGASTAAKQPALGTAGTASVDVLTVQGIASMTALKVDGTGGTFPSTQSGTWNISNVSGTVSLPTGASTSANQTSQITQETAINTVLGTTADTAWVSGSGTSIALLKNIATGIGSSIPAGSAIIGKVSIDQTTPNTTNAVSIAQIAGTTTATGSGAMNGGTQRIALATDSPGVIPFGNTTMSASVPVTIASDQKNADPCMWQAKTNLAISQSGTSSVQLVALSGSTSIYVCSLSLIAAGATTAVITTGTGTACATSNAAVIGDTTANVANGLSFATNGGLTLGNGGGTIAKGAASSQLCMTLGTNVRMSGNLTYVQQ